MPAPHRAWILAAVASLGFGFAATAQPTPGVPMSENFDGVTAPALPSSYTPPACQGLFADVPCPSPFADWIEDLFSKQIAAGCGNGNFCPNNPNTRGQMAVFLTKTFGLMLYGP